MSVSGELSREMCPQNIAIIGNRGRMGAMLEEKALRLGIHVLGIETTSSEEDFARLSQGIEMALFCVPAVALDKSLERVCAHLKKDCIVSDITSVKELPMLQMEKHWKGNVVGTHPLFGPEPKKEDGLRVVITPSSQTSEEAVLKVEGFFTRMGCHVFRASAQSHDWAMACVQNLNFITNIAYFALLSNKEEILPYVTPSFTRRLVSAQKMLTEDAEMFSQLFEINNRSQEVVRQFSKLLNLAASGDIEVLCKRAQWWWRS